MELLLTVISSLLTFENFLFLNLGVFCGIIIGALPGLTATLGVALLMPLTFGMEAIPGIILLIGVYCGGIYGGSITAILIKTPGTPASACTAIEGYVLAQRGEAGKALDLALKASTFGGLFSAVVLLFVAPQVSAFALTFSYVEYFALAVFGLSLIASVSGDNQIKGLIAGMLGLLIACVGMDPIDGTSRFVFVRDLLAGIDIIPIMIGVFAITEIIQKSKSVFKKTDEMFEFSNKGVSNREFFSLWPTLLRSSFIGTFVGAVPGTGAAIASFLSYSEAKRSSKHKELFEHGSLEGLSASEAANNGVTGATLIPLLTLGIPGDTVTAIMLGALMMQGLTPGPLLFTTHPDTLYTLMLAVFFANIFMFLQGKFMIRVFANVTKIPTAVLIPLLLNLCMIGSYAGNNSVFDVRLSVIFGLFGVIMMWLEIPLTPMVIAVVLGELAEANMRRGLSMSSGDVSIFFTRPVSLFFIAIAVCSLLFPTIRKLMDYSRAKRKANVTETSDDKN